ncbi:acyl carrier protein [Thermaurantiacus sp.]
MMATLPCSSGPALFDEVCDTLAGALGLAPAVRASLTPSSPLFGHLPELDSMAVATVLTALEDRFHILIDDEDVSAEMFETVGALAAFVDSRVNAR